MTWTKDRHVFLFLLLPHTQPPQRWVLTALSFNSLRFLFLENTLHEEMSSHCEFTWKPKKTKRLQKETPREKAFDLYSFTPDLWATQQSQETDEWRSCSDKTDGTMQHQQGKGHGWCLVCDDACRSAFADYIHTHIYTNTTSYPRVSLRSCSISLKAGPQVVIHLNLQQHLLLRPWFH